MGKTAVGLFKNRQSADKIVHDLEHVGLPGGDIHVVGEPLGMTGSGALSTAHEKFETDLKYQLEQIGASEPDREAYLKGLRRGGTLVMVTTPDDKADAAVQTMNEAGAIDIEELNKTDFRVPSVVPGNMSPIPDRGDLELEVPGRVHYSARGARLFVW